MTEIPAASVLARAGAGAQRTHPGAVVTELRRLPGGVSSLTYAASLAHGPAAKIVIKVAPAGLPAVRNRDVLRQARIMRALTVIGGVPVPQVLAEDDADPPLFVMEHVAGACYEPGTDITANPPPAGVVRDRMRAAAQTLARMQAITPAALGIGGEEEVTTPVEELDRWALLLETVEPGIVPGHHVLRDRLRAGPPAPVEPTLLHGDYRLGNMLFVGSQLSAIIDWEIWSVGDPRHDLAWLLMHCDPPHRFETSRPAADEAAASGLPSAAEVLEDYVAAQAHPADLSRELDWFLALCHYKVVSTVAVLSKRNRRLPEPDPRMLVAQAGLPGVLARAHRILDERPLQHQTPRR